MSNKIGIVVVGVGRWGVHLVRHFSQHPQTNLLAIVDRKPERLPAVQQQFNLDLSSVVLAKDWSEVRQLPAIQAVAIATPASTHYSLIKDALNQGYHVLAEKPLTLDPKECLELCRLAEQKQRQLMVDHTYLFHPAVQRGKEAIAALGKLRYGYAARTHLGPVRSDVDALWDLAIHDLCIFNFWLGKNPIQVQATGKIWLQRSENATNSNNSQEITTKNQLFSQGLADFVTVTLTYPSGFEAQIHLCWCNPDKQRRVCVVGSQGTLIFDEMSPNAPLMIQHGFLEQNNQTWQPVRQKSEVIAVPPGEPLRLVCDRFLDLVINPTQPSKNLPIYSAWLGAELVQILAALSQSLNQGGLPIKISG
jgi:predicted dehydrogenase